MLAFANQFTAQFLDSSSNAKHTIAKLADKTGVIGAVSEYVENVIQQTLELTRSPVANYVNRESAGMGHKLTLVLRDHLEKAGHGWWVWVAVVGVLLGLVGWEHTTRRRRRRHRADARAGSSPS